MKFIVIGIDDNKEQRFSQEIVDIIQTNTIFSGGKRHHEIVSPLLPASHQWIEIAVPLDNVFETYKNFDKVIIFASGDPLFYGFANTIQKRLPEVEIKVFPTFNSLQMLAHRLTMPYHDMHIVSLTGRDWNKFDEALISGYDKIGVLTDNKMHTPSDIARYMLDYGYDNYKMTIGELLGNKEEEKITKTTLKDATQKKFAYPNNLILQKTYDRPRPFGIPEDEFHLLDGRAKMITKMPVRLLSLSMLDLRNKTVFWDIGFCTGSVSIEAKLQLPHLQIVAFEQRNEGRELLKQNSQKFGTPGITTIIGDYTETDIADLPLPDAVFIGGHGGKIKEVISKTCSVLKENGVIVFNSVSEDSKSLFFKAIEEYNLVLEKSASIKVDNFNVIEVIKVVKKNEKMLILRSI